MINARSGWQAAAWAVRLARLDARRPAAWVSLTTAGLVTWQLAAPGKTAGGLVLPAAIGAGGLLAVAAIGVPAAGMPDGRRRPWAAAWLMRAAWPLSGACAAAAIGGGDTGAPLILAVAGVATTATALAGVAAGVTEAAAIAVSLAVTGVAAVASLAAGFIVPAPPSVQVATAAAAWGLAAAAAWFARSDEAGWSSSADRGGTATGRRVTLAPSMPRALVGAALITSLVTMVVCCFLVPAFSRLYAAVAGGWFLCLAVPPATSGVGGAGGRRLAAAAPGRPAVPGSVRRGIAVSAPILGVLGWPAIVALVLPAADGSRSEGPLAAILVLAGGWLLLVGAVASGGRRDGELARAMVLGAAAVAAGGLPGLPGLPGPAGLSWSRSVLSPGTDPARLPERRSCLAPPRLPRGPVVDVEIWSRRSR